MISTPLSKDETRLVKTRAALSERAVIPIGFGLALLLGGYARLAPVLAADFPLNDGGLFYALTQDLGHNHYSIPLWTAYNGGHIPFAYPPLGFFVAGLLSDVTGIALIDEFRLIPALLSLLTIPLAFLIGREIFSSVRYATLAMLVYASIPRSYQWLIMGGGIARALAMVLLFTGFYQLLLLLSTRQKRFVLTTGLVSGLALLSHPEATVFWAATFGLIAWFYGKRERAVLHCAVAALVTVGVAWPWWLFVWARFGGTPILSSLQAGGNNGLVWIVALLFGSSGEEFGTLWSILGLVGLAVAVAKRKWFLPLWYLLPFVLLPRSAGTYLPLPLALLVTLALGELIVPRLQELAGVVSELNRGRLLENNPAVSGAVGMFVLLALILALFNVWGANTRANSPLRTLPIAERTAMDWVAQHAPPEASFVVLTPATEWSTDFTAEWFPTLAARPSVATVQGQEWTAGAQFLGRVDDYNSLQECRTRDADCLERWRASTGKRFTNVYVSKGAIGQAGIADCCAALRYQLMSSPQYEMVYDNKGASVFKRR